ncbi:MAG: DUF3127 domain-containing protein [Bacteroidota bacterium]|nr:DUF3127 domain-containing protein [Bacteroidota bacterium]
MAFEIQGKLVAVYNTVQRSESFKTREFVIETNEESSGRTFTSYVKFQCTQERTSLCDKFKVGDNLKVHFNLRGSKWSKDGRDNYITNLDAWRIENMQAMNPSFEESKSSSNSNDNATSEEDDLPF